MSVPACQMACHVISTVRQPAAVCHRKMFNEEDLKDVLLSEKSDCGAAPNTEPSAHDDFEGDDLECHQFECDKATWDKLESDVWFHGAIARDDVELVLKEEGDFLIRVENSSSKQPLLTIRHPNIAVPDATEMTVYVFPFYSVETKDGPKFSLNTVHTANSPLELVRMHLTKAVPLYEFIMLKRGVPKQGGSEQ